ncbi:hypothetical protein Tsubulata_021938 [Turnera subulata]|uniref:Dynein light chain n=1 Tax=Turnera subulata TaxID=218843 RepID=A0A9Q0F295_9ROSI|nr:hypothetical protein Tsubulata_021938 [Turnera subulata]
MINIYQSLTSVYIVVVHELQNYFLKHLVTQLGRESTTIWPKKSFFEDSRKFEKELDMLEGKGMVKETDMPVKMQVQAMACASQALDIYDVLDCISIAGHIKKEFDKMYGGGWQCVVGSNFGCFFSHTEGTFIYFALESLNFLIFKGASS